MTEDEIRRHLKKRKRFPFSQIWLYWCSSCSSLFVFPERLLVIIANGIYVAANNIAAETIFAVIMCIAYGTSGLVYCSWCYCSPHAVDCSGIITEDGVLKGGDPPTNLSLHILLFQHISPARILSFRLLRMVWNQNCELTRNLSWVFLCDLISTSVYHAPFCKS